MKARPRPPEMEANLPDGRAVDLDRTPDMRGGGMKPGSDLWTPVVLFVLTVLLIFASRWVSPGLGGWSQARAMLLLSSFGMVLAFGQQMVILTGGLDLSVASVMTLGGVLVFNWNNGSAGSLVWAVPATLVVTGLVGAANGVGVTLLRVPPFIMTVAMGIIVYGVTLGFTAGTPHGHPSTALSALYTAAPGGIPPAIFLMIIFAVLGSVLQMYTPFGRKIYAIGTSPAAAHIAGLPVARLTIGTYAISGAAAGIAGILMAGYAGGATLTMGDSYLLPSVASVVVGGTSILGGRGTYPGAVGGTVLLTTLSSIISSVGIAEGWRTVIYGFVILLALLLLREELLARTGRWHVRARVGATASRSGDLLRGKRPEN